MSRAAKEARSTGPLRLLAGCRVVACPSSMLKRTRTPHMQPHLAKLLIKEPTCFGAELDGCDTQTPRPR